MISPQASIPRHWSSPLGERKDEDIERCPIILTSTKHSFNIRYTVERLTPKIRQTFDMDIYI